VTSKTRIPANVRRRTNKSCRTGTTSTWSANRSSSPCHRTNRTCRRRRRQPSYRHQPSYRPAVSTTRLRTTSGDSDPGRSRTRRNRPRFRPVPSSRRTRARTLPTGRGNGRRTVFPSSRPSARRPVRRVSKSFHHSARPDLYTCSSSQAADFPLRWTHSRNYRPTAGRRLRLLFLNTCRLVFPIQWNFRDFHSDTHFRCSYRFPTLFDTIRTLSSCPRISSQLVTHNHFHDTCCLVG